MAGVVLTYIILTVLTNDCLSAQYSGRLPHHSDTIKAGVLEKESLGAGQGPLQEPQEDEGSREEEVPGRGEAEQEGEEEGGGRRAVRGARAEAAGALHHGRRLGGQGEGRGERHPGELREYDIPI